jgi:hypothetical protein
MRTSNLLNIAVLSFIEHTKNKSTYETFLLQSCPQINSAKLNIYIVSQSWTRKLAEDCISIFLRRWVQNPSELRRSKEDTSNSWFRNVSSLQSSCLADPRERSSWETTGCLTSQNISSVLRNHKIPYWVHKIPPLIHFLNHKYSVHMLARYSFKINFTITLLSTSKSAKWSLSFRFSN